MDQMFNAAFILVATLIGGAGMVLTEKLKDVFKPATKFLNYILSLISTAIVTIAVKYLGAGTTWALLGFIGDELPGIPDIPTDVALGWDYWILVCLLSWGIANGFYDFFKSMFQKK